MAQIEVAVGASWVGSQRANTIRPQRANITPCRRTYDTKNTG